MIEATETESQPSRVIRSDEAVLIAISKGTAPSGGYDGAGESVWRHAQSELIELAQTQLKCPIAGQPLSTQRIASVTEYNRLVVHGSVVIHRHLCGGAWWDIESDGAIGDLYVVIGGKEIGFSGDTARRIWDWLTAEPGVIPIILD